ncbi:hypothetical protein ACFOLJ_30485 [Rugamonas sp. CCM 8940]|uniref:hypothetical protein n=1 Tax=Rugamonas sp. CCM 8940 TaxID=2765359 RepID=UPI0018F38F2C|nr:hypothetical protein [Rugamonas sp. CCM 8940]MBJ7313153.1 hypothetical protein [Rugamonas sp. CCM 8940]
MFSEALSPAVRAHCDVLFNFHTDLARRTLESLQAISEVNMRLLKEAMSELGEASQRVLSAGNPAGQTASARGNLGSTALRNYQQGLADALARANHSLAQSAEAHLPHVSRSANALADELVRKANDEAAKAGERQRQALERMGLHAANGLGRPSLTH